MLILILIDVQYLQNVAFSMKKGSNFWNHSSSDSPHPIKKSQPSKIFYPHFLPINLENPDLNY